MTEPPLHALYIFKYIQPRKAQAIMLCYYVRESEQMVPGKWTVFLTACTASSWEVKLGSIGDCMHLRIVYPYLQQKEAALPLYTSVLLMLHRSCIPGGCLWETWEDWNKQCVTENSRLQSQAVTSSAISWYITVWEQALAILKDTYKHASWHSWLCRAESMFVTHVFSSFSSLRMFLFLMSWMDWK